MKVVAIGGSPRLHGNTNYLIDQALDELASHGIETEKIVLNEYKVGPCQAHENCASFSECQQKDDGQWILEKFSQADGVILASPVYFGSISAQMKAFMDRSFFLFSHGMALNFKCAGLIAVAGRRGADATVEELRKLVRLAGSEILTLSGNSGSPDIDPKTQTELIEQAKTMAKQMAEILTAGSS
ncbi:MAG TPA: flavodoxin family protein [Dehalococcoidia bacterium]|nr:flavodoxin family protein [Dehalococcoidia bacterium]